jgi:hypothetical protein
VSFENGSITEGHEDRLKKKYESEKMFLPSCASSASW